MGIYDGILGRPSAPAPQQSAPIGPLGYAAEGFALGQQQRQDKSQAQGIIQQAQGQFQAIGTPEALQMSDLLARDPQTAGAMARQAGGFGKLAEGYQAKAYQETIGQIFNSGGGFRDAIEAGVPPDLALEAQIKMNKANEVGPVQGVFDPSTGMTTTELRGDAIGKPQRPAGGLNVTLPDGTRISQGGSGVGGLQKGTQKALEGDIVKTDEAQFRLNNAVTKYSPDLLTAGGKGKARWSGWLQFLGVDLSEEQLAHLKKSKDFENALSRFSSEAIHEKAGSAMSEQELKVILPGIPNYEMNSTDFEMSVANTSRELMAFNRRRRYLLSTQQIGARYNFTGGNSHMGIGEFNRLYSKRRSEIWKQVSGESPDSPKGELIQITNDRIEAELDSGDIDGW